MVCVPPHWEDWHCRFACVGYWIFYGRLSVYHTGLMLPYLDDGVGMAGTVHLLFIVFVDMVYSVQCLLADLYNASLFSLPCT
jgi:hypothetical protein